MTHAAVMQGVSAQGALTQEALTQEALTHDALTHDALTLSCRPGCGACCTAPSISSAIPGMPDGKPAGVPCIQLMPDLRCAIFGDPRRPAVCGGLQPSAEMCGPDRGHAIRWLTELEAATAPATASATALATAPATTPVTARAALPAR